VELLKELGKHAYHAILTWAGTFVNTANSMMTKRENKFTIASTATFAELVQA